MYNQHELPLLFSETRRDISSSGMSSVSHDEGDEGLSVSSFRKTLDEETRRLNVLCTVWRDILENDKDGRLDDTTKVCAVLQMHSVVYCMIFTPIFIREIFGALLDKPSW